MSKKLFGNDDVFTNRLKMHPELDFFIYNSEVYLNGEPNISGSNSDTYKNVPPGYISLYELNINRKSGKGTKAFPFVEGDIFNNALYGHSNSGVVKSISGSYPLSSSIFRKYTDTAVFQHGTTSYKRNLTGSVLYNIGRNKYSVLSKRFSTSHFTASGINIIDIPSIFYGSSIKKGTINLKYFITGTLIASAVDERQNGELISDYGNSSGSVVGLVYYDEGVMAFPMSSSGNPMFASGDKFSDNYFYSGVLDDGNDIKYLGDGSTTDTSASWAYFGVGANDGISHDSSIASASFSINFRGTSYKNTLTLMCHAEKAEMNWSNNPSYLNQTASDYSKFTSNSMQYYELQSPIKNIVSSSYVGHSASFAKTTYITKVGIYDEYDNLIMIAELARPYKKEEEKDITFKLKYDLL